MAAKLEDTLHYQTRKHSSTMRTAHFPTLRDSVTTRCQHWWGSVPQVNKFEKVSLYSEVPCLGGVELGESL